MLSRRHLRIKVLQALYGAEENSTTSVGVKEKNLFNVGLPTLNPPQTTNLLL